MTDPAEQSVALPAVFDLDALDAVRDRLLDCVENGPVRVMAPMVERLATNALLMLLSAARTAEANGYSFEIASASPAMQRAIERLGLERAFHGLMGD